MDDIRTILRMAGHRLEAGSLLRCLNATVIGLGILVVFMLGAERVGAALFLPWGWLGPLVESRSPLGGRLPDPSTGAYPVQ